MKNHCYIDFCCRKRYFLAYANDDDLTLIMQKEKKTKKNRQMTKLKIYIGKIKKKCFVQAMSS